MADRVFGPCIGCHGECGAGERCPLRPDPVGQSGVMVLFWVAVLGLIALGGLIVVLVRLQGAL